MIDSSTRAVGGPREAELVGTFHRFGQAGPAYEVTRVENDEMVRVRVLESGETLSYPVVSVRSDPDA